MACVCLRDVSSPSFADESYFRHISVMGDFGCVSLHENALVLSYFCLSLVDLTVVSLLPSLWYLRTELWHVLVLQLSY